MLARWIKSGIRIFSLPILLIVAFKLGYEAKAPAPKIFPLGKCYEDSISSRSQNKHLSELLLPSNILSTQSKRISDPLAAMTGEPIVLVGTNASRLAFMPSSSHPLSVRNTYLDLPGTIHYKSGIDYAFDTETGEISRTPQSRIPDFASNPIYGKNKFGLNDFPGMTNQPYFTFIDYTLRKKAEWPQQPTQISLLPRTQKKLRSGEKITIIAFGDSITAGSEASDKSLSYWERWLQLLRNKYPGAIIASVNSGIGGTATYSALPLLETNVLKHNPDLVLIAFGMNDHNIGEVPPAKFEKDLRKMIDLIRTKTEAEIILLSTFPPNPKWANGSHQMENFAAATELVAIEKHCAFVDIYHNWLALAERKKPEDLLANNVNNPNEFGHWIYFQVLARLDI